MKFQLLIMAIVMSLIMLPAQSTFAESKSYWGRGLLIGSISGATVGAVAGYFVDRCSSNREENDWPCGIGAFVFGSAGLLVGGAIGTVVGAGIKKQPKISIVPTAMISPKGNLIGGGLGVNGRF